MTTPSTWMLGTYAGGIGGMTSIDTLLADKAKDVDPDFSYKPYADVVELGSGGTRGIGLPQCTMHWSHLNVSQREAIRAIVTGTSAHVYIRIPIDDTTSGALVWHTFSCWAYWPVREEGKESGNQILDFPLTFKDLVQEE